MWCLQRIIPTTNKKDIHMWGLRQELLVELSEHKVKPIYLLHGSGPCISLNADDCKRMLAKAVFMVL